MAAERRARISAPALILLVFVALAILAIDQVTKFLVVQNMQLGQTIDVIGEFLQFIYVRNSGAAFSIGAGSTWIFSIVGVGVLVVIVWFVRRIRSPWWALLFGLLLGGLLGNLGDRLFRAPGFGIGEVVDFIRLPFPPAVFNLADSAIVVSMALFLLLTLLGVGLDGRRHASKQAGPLAPSDTQNETAAETGR